MVKSSKIKRRGLVMTGGGAKGLYEAGVLYAFHLTGVEFDVICGSSIGAMNAIFFAEYLRQKKCKLRERPESPEKIMEELETLMRCFQRTWLLMPSEHIIDDSDTSALGLAVKDLSHFNLRVSDLVRLGWWLTDPKHTFFPPAQVWPAALRVAWQLLRRLGDGSAVRGMRQVSQIWKSQLAKPIQPVGGGLKSMFLRISNGWKTRHQQIIRDSLRTYLRYFGLQSSIISGEHDGKPGEDGKIEAMFTQKVAPLTAEHLRSSVTDKIGDPRISLLDRTTTLKEYLDEGIDVRLTRANYRTGRLEISAYISNQHFVRYLKKQSWRLELLDPDKAPLGVFRIELPGNPNAVKAALASGRFPGVFAPFHFHDIYSQSRQENHLLFELLKDDHWLSEPVLQDDLKQAYFAAYEGATEQQWTKLLAGWQQSNSMRSFFPYPSDTYVDGGAIDNTPSNSAVDATKEWLEANGESKRDAVLDVYTVFLDIEQLISQDDAREPLLYEVIQRTLAIQAAATKSSEAVVVDTINRFGQRAEDLAQTLLVVLSALEKLQDQLKPEQFKEIEAMIRTMTASGNVNAFQNANDKEILQQIRQWAENLLKEQLPLPVREIKIYPEKMALSTLQFTERLGYRQDNAIEMLTMGCYDTLWTIRSHLESLIPEERDEQEVQALNLSRKWMGIENWSSEKGDAPIRQSWQCTRKDDCLFYAEYCLHGAKSSQPAMAQAA